MPDVVLIAILFIVGFAAAWQLGRRSARRASTSDAELPTHYIQGLNFLLNEQPDKAIEVFVKLIEVDSETVETHFALGNLFRRRGETERAIRVHQNLIARTTLSNAQRTLALYELGLDYMRAGILSRAESVFLQLVDDDTQGIASLKQLTEIYQQEREWDKAITTIEKLEKLDGPKRAAIVAQFYCELAEHELTQGNHARALEHVDTALQRDPTCVRASLLLGQIRSVAGDIDAALAAYARVEKQDPDFLPETFAPLDQLYEQSAQPQRALEYFQHVYRQYGGIPALLAVAERLRKAHGDDAASAFIADQLRKKPSVRGLHRLIELNLERSRGEARDNLLVLKELMSRLMANRPSYKCRNCGFNAKALHWQCPGCKMWNSQKPIQSMEGDTP